jgi:hypothetical protein
MMLAAVKDKNSNNCMPLLNKLNNKWCKFCKIKKLKKKMLKWVCTSANNVEFKLLANQI